MLLKNTVKQITLVMEMTIATTLADVVTGTISPYPIVVKVINV